MDPPIRQKPIHHRPLRREHVRVLLLAPFLRLARTQSRAWVVAWLPSRVRVRAAPDSAATTAGPHNPRPVRRWPELVGLAEDVGGFWRWRVGCHIVIAAVTPASASRSGGFVAPPWRGGGGGALAAEEKGRLGARGEAAAGDGHDGRDGTDGCHWLAR